jgi:hypothetical protein
MTLRSSSLARNRRQLARFADLPPELARHPALHAIAVLVRAAKGPIHHALVPGSIAAQLSIVSLPEDDPVAEGFIHGLEGAVSVPANGESKGDRFSPSGWVESFDYLDFITSWIAHTKDDRGRAALLQRAATAAQSIARQRHTLEQHHLDQLIARDVPALTAEWHRAPDHRTPLIWALAPEHDSDPGRALRVHRRVQALSLFAALHARLRDPAITRVIDAGQPLVPALGRLLGLGPAELAALRGARPVASLATEGATADYERALRMIKAHKLPLHQWPGGGRPDQAQAWARCRWLRKDRHVLTHLPLIPAAFLEPDPETIGDAVRAFQEDLLEPLLKSPELCAGQPAFRLRQLSETLVRPDFLDPRHLTPVQNILGVVRAMLIGPRGPAAFHKAAATWHRRAPALAALRQEHQQDLPGWPPLSLPWTSPCTRYRIVPLTSARELVAEGEAHGHCVGTYYSNCRTGLTQILSLRASGKPVVTAEILLDPTLSELRVGQFKGAHDKTPQDPVLHQVMRDFLRDLRTGAHPLNRRALRQYLRWVEKNPYYGGGKTLDLDHATRAYPLYRALLPRGIPDTFAEWSNGFIGPLKTAIAGLDPSDPGF